jgi:hypothetical protein
MNQQEKESWLATMQILIESAVESEQSEPQPFKIETEHRIDLVMAKLSEVVGLIGNS